MGVIDRIRALLPSSKPETAAKIEHECLHGVLVASWANVNDMGNEDKATEFVCQSCHAHFSPDQAGWIRKRALERLRG